MAILDVAMFNANLGETANEIPLYPISEAQLKKYEESWLDFA